MTNQKRTLEILLKVLDQTSAPVRKIGAVFGSTFADISKRLGKFRVDFNAAFAGVLAGYAGLAGIKQLAGVFGELSQSLRELAETSDQVGVTAESLAALNVAAGASGVPFEQLAGAMRTLTKNAGEASRGSAEQAETFRRLGIDTQILASGQADAVDVMADVADALAGIGDRSQQAALASKLFGDAGIKLLPLLRQGREALLGFEEGLRKSGLALSEANIANVVAMSRAMDQFRTTVAALAQKVTAEVAPAVEVFFQDLNETIKLNGPAIRNAIVEILQILVRGGEAVVGVGLVLSSVARGFEVLATSAQAAYAAVNGSDAEMLRAVDNLRKLAEAQTAAEAGSAALLKRLEELRQQIGQLREAQNVGRAAPVQVQGQKPADPTEWDRYWGAFSDGAAKATAQWKDFEHAGRQAGETLANSVFQGTTDALTDIITGTKTAEEAFKDFGRSMLRTLAQIISKLIVVKTLNAFGLGSVNTAAETGAVVPGQIQSLRPARRFAMGGVVRSPTIALFGEGKASKGEAFVPLPDGRRIPVHQTGGGGGNVNVTIHAMDGADVQRVLSRERGLLLSLWSDDAMRKRGTRQLIQGASA